MMSSNHRLTVMLIKRKNVTTANEAPFSIKEVNKEIMTKPGMINKFSCFRFNENKEVCTEQLHLCVKGIRKVKKHYSNLNVQI